jgi:hypothetical protein
MLRRCVYDGGRCDGGLFLRAVRPLNGFKKIHTQLAESAFCFCWRRGFAREADTKGMLCTVRSAAHQPHAAAIHLFPAETSTDVSM